MFCACYRGVPLFKVSLVTSCPVPWNFRRVTSRYEDVSTFNGLFWRHLSQGRSHRSSSDRTICRTETPIGQSWDDLYVRLSCNYVIREFERGFGSGIIGWGTIRNIDMYDDESSVSIVSRDYPFYDSSTNFKLMRHTMLSWKRKIRFGSFNFYRHGKFQTPFPSGNSTQNRSIEWWYDPCCFTWRFNIEITDEREILQLSKIRKCPLLVYTRICNYVQNLSYYF